MKRPLPNETTPTPRSPPLASADERTGLASLALVALVAGAASGLVGTLFRLALDVADKWRNILIAWAHGYSLLGLVLVVALAAAATALAAWLVRRFSPEASGSGIPHVEAVLHEKAEPADIKLLPVKFVGGLLAIGSGLALGREGPSVQMGASVSHLVGRIFRRNPADARILLAAGAGAGLATAFSAPIAGSVFVLEELMRRFDTRITITTLGASAAAIGILRIFLGDGTDFTIDALPSPTLGSLALYLVFGLLVGLLGVAYNRAILGGLATADRFSFIPVEVRAATVGAAVGLLAWFYPTLVGGGDPLTQNALNGVAVIAWLPAVLALRFALGAVSYAAGTPGGLFAPMLVIGAQAGLCFGTLAVDWFPDVVTTPLGFAVTGMAAFFTATVRCPVTGIVLVIELTSSITGLLPMPELLPMLTACFTAMLVPTLTGNPPIYDSLGELSTRQKN